jgi:hypothetical protein
MLGLVYGKLSYTKETHRTKIGPFEMETFPSDQRLDPNLVNLRGLALPKSGAGDGNRTHTGAAFGA